ncbi:hypothetical protein WG66_010044 [Moniliophthora roreri]|nr:hypothetical protein WG66_010044 [Moniliophthora roreri]
MSASGIQFRSDRRIKLRRVLLMLPEVRILKVVAQQVLQVRSARRVVTTLTPSHFAPRTEEQLSSEPNSCPYPTSLLMMFCPSIHSMSLSSCLVAI